MKKIILFLTIVFYIWSASYLFAADKKTCWDVADIWSTSLWTMLDDCRPTWTIDASSTKWWIIKFKQNSGYTVDDAKTKIYSITMKWVILATILAIGWLVYAGILFNTSYWDDSKNKKAKEAVKYSLIGLLIALLAQQLTNAIVNLIYSIS